MQPYDYVVYDEENLLAGPTTILAEDINQARDLAIVDLTSHHSEIDLRKAQVVVRPFAR